MKPNRLYSARAIGSALALRTFWIPAPLSVSLYGRALPDSGASGDFEMALFIKDIPPSILEEIRDVTVYYPDTGAFVYRVKTNTRNWEGKVVGAPNTGGHIAFQYKGKKYMAHRVIWELMFGPVPHGLQVDHINGDKLDNRASNLRLVSHGWNMQNRRSPSKTKASGLPLGTYYSKSDKNWYASIRYGGKAHRIGSFHTPEAAHQAYLEAKRKYHPGCTI